MPAPPSDSKAAEEALKSTYRSLSPLGRDFLREVTTNPALARPIDWQSAELPAWILANSYPLQSWPTFLGQERREELARVTVGLTRLVAEIPRRLFDGQAEPMARAYGGLDPAMLGFLLAPPDGLGALTSRCDLIYSAKGFQCLEVNAGTLLGGWMLRFWADWHLAHPRVRDFLAKTGYQAVFRDSLRLFFRQILEDTLGHGIGQEALRTEVRLVLLVDQEGLPMATLARESLQRLYDSAREEVAPGLSGELLVLSDQTPLKSRRGCLYYDGKRVHALVDYTDADTPANVYRAFKAETLRLFGGPLANILGSKNSLALLSERADSDLFDAQERSLLQDHLPWCRQVAPGTGRFHDEEAPLRDLLLRHRERMVLKPAGGKQGTGIVFGAATPAPAWQGAVDQALGEAGAWVAQERVEASPQLFQSGDEGFEPHIVIWGAFCFGNTYGGGTLRMAPVEATGQGGIVNASAGAVEGLYYEI